MHYRNFHCELSEGDYAGMNYSIDNIHAIFESRNAWIPSEDSKNKQLIAYTLWLGNSIRAYCAGHGDEWTAWVFYRDVDFEKDDFRCYQYTCKKYLLAMYSHLKMMPWIGQKLFHG